MRCRVAIACVTFSAIAPTSSAHADERTDIFGLGKPPANPRDVFGLEPRPTAPPVDCTDARTFGCTGSTSDLDDVTPYSLTTYLPTDYLVGLPVGYATHDAVAAYATAGAARDEQGLGFTGTNGLETRWTVDGAPADSVRTGGADTQIPLAFLRGIRVTAGGFSARDRASTGGTVDAELIEGTAHHEVRAELYESASAAPRTRELAFGMFQLRRISTRAEPATAATLVATGPVAPLAAALGATRAWYAAGLGADITPAQFHRVTNGLVDADASGHADQDPATAGGYALAPIASTRDTVVDYTVPLLARIGIDGAHHHLALSVVGDFAVDHPTLQNATVQASGIDRHTTTGDAIATYRFAAPDTTLKLQLAYHRSGSTERAHDAAAANIPQLLSAYVPGTLVEDPALAAACASASPTFTPCPIPTGYFASGGAGLLVDQIGERTSATADLAHRIAAHHVLRVGATAEDAHLITDSRYTGGELDRSLFPGHTDHASFRGDGDCTDLVFDGPCDYLAVSHLDYRTLYAAAYAEDTFRPSRDLAVDAGLRYELMWVGPALHFSRELAPRVGLVWDVPALANARVFASLGRSFAYLPAGVGFTVLPRDRYVHDVEIASVGTTRNLEGGNPDTIARDLQPTQQDEALAGIAVGLPHAAYARVYVQARRLLAMETAGTELANPTDGRASAERETRAGGIELATTGKLALRIGYAYTWARGNTVGMADPRQGAVLFAGSDFNGDPSTNQFGALPTDLTHRVFIEARRGGHLDGVPVAVSTRLTASSGRPRDTLGESVDGIVFLLPRGDGGRGPVLTQMNTELSAHVLGADVVLDVFDLFDHTDPTAVEAAYTTTSALPISGGTARDLVFLRGISGAPVQRWTPYQFGQSFQSPISATLGIRRRF